MEKDFVFLKTQHKHFFTNPISLISMKCTEEKENVGFHSKTISNLHYQGKRYGGQESVDCSHKQCT